MVEVVLIGQRNMLRVVEVVAIDLFWMSLQATAKHVLQRNRDLSCRGGILTMVWWRTILAGTAIRAAQYSHGGLSKAEL